MLPNRNYIWIGLHRDPTNISAFSWTDNSAFDYVNWAEGQPVSSGGYNYVYMSRNSGNMWSNTESWYTLGAVCKRNLEQSQPTESFHEYSGFNDN